MIAKRNSVRDSLYSLASVACNKDVAAEPWVQVCLWTLNGERGDGVAIALRWLRELLWQL